MRDTEARGAACQARHTSALVAAMSLAPRFPILQQSLIAVACTILAVGGSANLLASKFWIADVLTSFQVHYAVGLLLIGLVLFLLRRPRWAIASWLAFLGFAWPIAAYFPRALKNTPESEKSYRLMSFNVLYQNLRTEDVADYINDQLPDFLLLLETNRFWVKEMEFELQTNYPHRWSEPEEGAFGLMFLSRIPWESISLETFSEVSSVLVKFRLDGKPLHIIGTHPCPPMGAQGSQSRNRHFQNLAASCQQEGKAALILAGDLNCTPWSPHFRGLLRETGLQDAAWGRGFQPTWYRFPTVIAGIPIDHILHNDQVEVHTRWIGPNLGSDHRPVVVSFRLK